MAGTTHVIPAASFLTFLSAGMRHKSRKLVSHISVDDCKSEFTNQQMSVALFVTSEIVHLVNSFKGVG